MSEQPITCAEVRRYYLRNDFLQYLFRVLLRRSVVLCAAAHPIGSRYYHCRSRLTADSVNDLRKQIGGWLDRAFADFSDGDVPSVYPSLHYAVNRMWPGGRDLVVEVDAVEWQDAWSPMEPIAGLFTALEIQFTLTYSGHCSPHLCMAEEDFPPADAMTALRRREAIAARLKAWIEPDMTPDVRIDTDLPMVRLPFSLHELTGQVCLEIPPERYGQFDPSVAHPDRVSVETAWPPTWQSERTGALLAWAEGRRDISASPLPLFQRPVCISTPEGGHGTVHVKIDACILRETLRVTIGTAPPFAGTSPKEMTGVPAGPFITGDLWDIGLQLFFELGEPMMTIAETGAFFIDRLPVTNAQYRVFIDDGGYVREEFWSAEGRQFLRAYGWTGPACAGEPAEYPLRGVSYFEAEAYARWCGKRLPTHAEWEKACRGADGRRWPWGDAFDATCCNTADRYPPGERWAPTPAGAFPAGVSPYGCLDMVGNIWEWLADITVIGGSYQSHFADSSLCECYGEEPYFRESKVGFRCVKDIGGT